MKTKAKTFHIIVWSLLTLAGFNLLAAKEPLYDGLGSYSRKITTKSAEAQRYFDQGLGFLHGFNHRAAIRAFQQAAKLDPKCAMAHWGVALACGPHINSIVVPPPAAKHIRAMVAEMPSEFLTENALQAEGNVAMPLEVMVRFGLWDNILAEPERYTDKMWFTRAFHHAARAIAYAAKGDTASARNAQSVFVERAKLVPKEDFVSNNSCEALLAVAIPMVEGEILIAEGKIDSGIEQLRAAIQKEDALKYDEPPGWLIPVRHSLGAVLMKQQRFAEAEQVYRDDLARLLENGWSLLGLAESLRKQKKNAGEV
jgi:tetratricopeptide (TPR) repeat protein